MAYIEDLTFTNAAGIADTDIVYIGKPGDIDPDRRTSIAELAARLAGAPGAVGVSINAQTTTAYTLVLNDALKLVTCNNASPVTVTLPNNSSVAYPIGTVIVVAQIGAGKVTITGASGVFINAGSSVSLAGIYASVSLTKLSTNTWLASGGIE